MKLLKAMELCKVRGYISRRATPEIHYWKNTVTFNRLSENIMPEARDADDWETHDPEGDETSIVG